MQCGLQAKLFKTEFYINIMIRLGKEEQNNHCTMMVEKKLFGI